MTLDERVVQVEVEVAQHTELLCLFAAGFENLTAELTGISQRAYQIEARLANVEADLAIVKGWVEPRSV